MKVLISRGVFGDQLGGAETEMVDVIDELVKSGHSIDVVTNRKNFLSILEPKINQSYFLKWPNESHHAMIPLNLLKLTTEFRKILRNSKYDAVLAETKEDYMAAILANKFLPSSTPVFFRDHSDIKRPHELGPGLSGLAKIYDKMFLSLLRSSAGILTVSHYDKKFIVRKLGAKPTVHVVHSGINLPKIKSKLVDPKADGLVGGTVTRIVEDKGLSEVVEAISELQKKHDISAVVVGDGPFRGDLELLSKKFTANIEFAGYAAEPSSYYQKIDVFIQSSYYEGWSRTVSEALAHGCVLVASDIPTQKEQLGNGKYGVLYKTGDVADLSEKLSNLLNNPERMAGLSKNGPKRADEIANIDKIVKEQLIPILSGEHK